jgi:tetratricopeptide (TPR) repeat protein
MGTIDEDQLPRPPVGAIPAFERAHSVCREWSLELNLPGAAACLGLTYALAGRVHEGLAILEAAVETDAAKGLMRSHALTVTWLGEAHLLAGELNEASQRAGHALHLSRIHKERGHQAWVLRLLGEIESHYDPALDARAEEHYGEALALAHELGMRPLAAHCHHGLGKLYRRAGKPEQAREHFVAATTMYRDMDMRFWLAQAEANLTR